MISAKDRQRIEEAIKQKYVRVVFNPEGNFRYPAGRAGPEGPNFNHILVIY
jgi:hypothetical protein